MSFQKIKEGVTRNKAIIDTLTTLNFYREFGKEEKQVFKGQMFKKAVELTSQEFLNHLKTQIPQKDYDQLADVYHGIYGESIFEGELTPENKTKIDSIKNLKKLLDDGVPPQEWYIEKIVPKGSVVVIGGTAGSFKTWFAMQLSTNCANGEPFMDLYETEKCNILYIDEENGLVTIPNRFNSLINDKENLNLENINISIFNNIILDYQNNKASTLIDDMINKFKPNIVIIDSLVRCMHGEEDSASDVRAIFENLKSHLETGVSFIILHHTTKNNRRSMAGLRGSGDLAAFADVILMLTGGKEGYCNVEIVKNRHIEIDESCRFFFQLVTKNNQMKIEYRGQKDEKGDVTDRCVDDIIEWIEKGQIVSFSAKNATKLTQSKMYSKNTNFAALKNMVERGILSKPRRGLYVVENSEFHTVNEELV